MNLTTEEVKKFREFGYINKLIFKDSECEFLKNHFGNLKKKYTQMPFNNKSNDRIMNPHFFDETSKNILLNSDLFEYAAKLLNSDVYAVQTMFFERGSEQTFHQDNFYLHKTIGIWIALDDVNERNGSICVQNGSHKYDFICSERVGISNPQDLKNEKKYADLMKKVYLYNKNNFALKDKIIKLKKGFAVILDGRLIHWALPVLDKKSKRRVIVNHYIDAKTKWPYINWPKFSSNGVYMVQNKFEKMNLHPFKI